MPLHHRPQRFEQVEREAVAGLLVGVQDPEAGVEAYNSQGREAAFGFGQGADIVEQGVDRVGGVAGAALAGVQRAAPRAERAPAVGDPRLIAGGKPASDAAGLGGHFTITLAWRPETGVIGQVSAPATPNVSGA